LANRADERHVTWDFKDANAKHNHSLSGLPAIELAAVPSVDRAAFEFLKFLWTKVEPEKQVESD
jgi:hypothetical protein